MKFILTKELGRLAKWLRILGYDAEYYKEENLSSLVVTSLRDNRIILTRNQRLPRQSSIKIMLLKPENLKEQIKETLKILNLKPNTELMFSRCILCNVELAEVEKDKIKDRVPEYVFMTHDKFVVCPQCKRIYWQGTHWGNVKDILKEICSL
jgi:uncharacterized protein with PIN domain